MARKTKAVTARYQFSAPQMGWDERLAQPVGEELERLKEQSGKDGIDPVDVVNAARNRKSVLHGFFEWDDSKAAEEFRLEQARRLVRHVLVIYQDDGKQLGPTRMFINLKGERHKNEATYIPVMSVLSDAEKRQRLLNQCLAELESVRQRYMELVELSNVFREIDRAKAKLKEGAPAPRKRGRPRKSESYANV
jgi:hypothetical protein